MKTYCKFLARVIGAGLSLGAAAALVAALVFWVYGDRFFVNRSVGVGCLVLCFSAMWSSAHLTARSIRHLQTSQVPPRQRWAANVSLFAGFAEWLFAASVAMAAFLGTALPNGWSIMDANHNGFVAFERGDYSYSVFVWAWLPIAGALLALVGSRIVYFLVLWTLALVASVLWRSWQLVRWSFRALLARPEDLGLEPLKKP
jgi:hypothetical protein